MSRRHPPRWLLLGAGLTLLALGGCGEKAHTAADVAPPPAARLTAQQAADSAIALLRDGKADEARSVLSRFQAQQPGDPTVTSLLQQIDADPVQQLGPTSYDYEVKAGETLADVAEHLLGNPTLFYILGRYNHLTFPVTLAPGQVLRIPGERKVVKTRVAPDRGRAAAVAHAASKPVAPKPVAQPTADPARAARLRAAALEQLNRGQVERAVALLQQADAASPGNPLIRRDLERALRIRKTVHP